LAFSQLDRCDFDLASKQSLLWSVFQSLFQNTWDPIAARLIIDKVLEGNILAYMMYYIRYLPGDTEENHEYL